MDYFGTSGMMRCWAICAQQRDRDGEFDYWSHCAGCVGCVCVVALPVPAADPDLPPPHRRVDALAASGPDPALPITERTATLQHLWGADRAGHRLPHSLYGVPHACLYARASVRTRGSGLYRWC